MTWLEAIEGILGMGFDYTVNHSSQVRMAQALRQQNTILRKTNPWKVSIAIPNGYQCRYCRIHVRFTCPPNPMSFMEEHEEDCIWRNLSDDVKELMEEN